MKLVELSICDTYADADAELAHLTRWIEHKGGAIVHRETHHGGHAWHPGLNAPRVNYVLRVRVPDQIEFGHRYWPHTLDTPQEAP